MQCKPTTAIAVVFLIVASVLLAGCTTNTKSNLNQTPSASTVHDALLELYLAELENSSYANKNYTINAWVVTWINSTSARLEYAYLNKSANVTVNETYIVFPTIQDATHYLDAINKTNYSLASTRSPVGGPYEDAIGRTPQVYKNYVWISGSTSNLSEYARHEITQLDNIIVISTIKFLS